MKTKRFFWVLLALLMMSSLVLGACDGKTEEPVDVAEEPEPELVVLDLWIFEGEEEFLVQLVDLFNEQHDDIRLELTLIPEDDYTVKIETALAAGAPPDIGFVFDLTWIKAGHFLNLDDMVTSEGLNLDDYFPGAMQAYCVYEGEVYCFGSYSGGMVMFYNKDMFDTISEPYPSSTEPMSVDEYAALAAKFANNAENIEDRVWGGSSDIMLYWSDTRYLFSEDGLTATIDDEATSHAHQVLADMMENGSAMAGADYDLVDSEAVFVEGKLALWLIDNVIGVTYAVEADMRYGVIPVPVEQEGDLPWVSSWTDAFGVFAGSDNPVEATEFIAFLASEGSQIRADLGMQPFNLSLADEIGWADENEGRQELMQVMALSRDPVFIPDFWGVIDPLWDAWEFITSGDMTAQEAFDDAAPYVQENLDEAWETWNSIGE